jgi:membrane protease subunit (stomatin/prohibitin family)
MNRRTSKGFIELEWTCPNCSTRNKGFQKTCVNCGAPQPDNVQFEAPAEKKFVSEEQAGELKKRGADIHCGFCGTRNPSTATTCSQCGADLKEGKARESGREIDMPAGKLESVTCPNCGTENPGANINCTKCGAPLPRPASLTPAVPASTQVTEAAAKGAMKKPNWLLIGGIIAALAICCVGALVLFVFPSQSVQATVSDVYWQTSVPVQEIRAVDYNDERGSPPSGAYNVSCREESQEFCEEKTIDRGDGSAEVVEECHTETQQYCDYTVDEWSTIQTYTLDGHDLNPFYEQPSLSSDQRLGNEQADFTVYFDTPKGEITYNPGDLGEFQQFQPGSTWTLKLNAVGGVLSVER